MLVTKTFVVYMCQDCPWFCWCMDDNDYCHKAERDTYAKGIPDWCPERPENAKS